MKAAGKKSTKRTGAYSETSILPQPVEQQIGRDTLLSPFGVQAAPPFTHRLHLAPIQPSLQKYGYISVFDSMDLRDYGK